MRRDHLVEDVFTFLAKHITVAVSCERRLGTHHSRAPSPPKDLRKPLKVRLVGGGEQGLDMGGVQKEMFQQLFQTILDPAYGMFEEDPDSRALWPLGTDRETRSIPILSESRCFIKLEAESLESLAKYELVGMLLGLALFNNVVLGLNFPPAFYKALLQPSPTWQLADLVQVKPTLAENLQKLLDYEGQDVEDVFSLTFAVMNE